MINPIYNLPEMNFVGGESQTLIFNLYTKQGAPFGVDECTLDFAVIDYVNKSGEPILTKQAPDIAVQCGNEGVSNVVVIDLSPEDTVYFQGRYIYQLTVLGSDGATEIPGQGIVNITHNIHQHFITN